MIQQNQDSCRMTLSRRFENWQIGISFQPLESPDNDEDEMEEEIFFADRNSNKNLSGKFDDDDDDEYFDKRSCSFQISIHQDVSSPAVARMRRMTNDSLVLQCLFRMNKVVIVSGAVLSASPEMIHSKPAIEMFPHDFVAIPPGELNDELTGFLRQCVQVNDVMSKFMGEYSDYMYEKQRTRLVTICKEFI
jgi:hypothetical protein